MEKQYTQAEFEERLAREKQQFNSAELLKFAKEHISQNYIVNQKKNIFSTRFNADTVAMYLSNPQKNEKRLRELSIILSTISPQYAQIINYLPSISLFVPIITPNIEKYKDVNGEIKKESTKKLKKDYLTAVAQLDKMAIQHELTKAFTIMVREDIFYGYVYDDKDSFGVQQLDADFCRVKYQMDGCLFYELDMSYFDKYNDLKDIEGKLIDSYPVEVQKAYKAYLSDKTNNKWYSPDEDKQMCFKYNESLPFNYPPFASLYDGISDLEDYKGLGKTKAEIDNYKLIGLQIPLLNGASNPDDFAVDTNTAMAFYNMISQSLPEGVGAFLTPMAPKDFSFQNTAMSDKNEIGKAEDSLYNSSSFSGVVFGKGATGSTALKTSNLIDSSKCYMIYRQFERWLNHYFKKKFGGKFTVNLLNVTQHTLEDEFDRLYKLATVGVPVKLHLNGLIMNQSQERGALLMEELLDLHDTWKPLNMSSTQSSSGEVGNVEKGTDISESGERTKDAESNIN